MMSKKLFALMSLVVAVASVGTVSGAGGIARTVGNWMPDTRTPGKYAGKAVDFVNPGLSWNRGGDDDSDNGRAIWNPKNLGVKNKKTAMLELLLAALAAAYVGRDTKPMKWVRNSKFGRWTGRQFDKLPNMPKMKMPKMPSLRKSKASASTAVAAQ